MVLEYGTRTVLACTGLITINPVLQHYTGLSDTGKMAQIRCLLDIYADFDKMAAVIS